MNQKSLSFLYSYPFWKELQILSSPLVLTHTLGDCLLLLLDRSTLFWFYYRRVGASLLARFTCGRSDRSDTIDGILYKLCIRCYGSTDDSDKIRQMVGSLHAYVVSQLFSEAA